MELTCHYPQIAWQGTVNLAILDQKYVHFAACFKV